MSEAVPEHEATPEAEAAPPTGGLGVSVTQGLPDVTMVVNEGNVVSPSGDDRSYEAGEQFTVSGPDAIALAAGGHASVVGPAAAPSENGASAEAPPEDAPPAEEAPAE